ALLSDQRVDVLALSELTCLVLPREHCKLLQSKSIWMFDGRDEASSLMERILHLVPIEVNLFRGITLPGAPRGRQIFGGQLIGQALAAASKTFGCLKFAHHVQAYFLRGGDYKVPTIFKVFQVHDGKDITTRRVEAIQEGKLAFLLVASFLKEADGLEHQEAVMPTVPSPDMLLSIEDVMEKSSLEYHLSSDENKKKRLDPFPIDIRVCNPDILTRLSRPPPRLSYWFKSREKLSDDPALHQCVVAYASDLIFIQVSTNPHQRGDYVIRTLSLNHTMWFHRTTRADEWILHVIDSPLAYDARGICTSQMFNTKGELVASLVQEGLLRRDNTINTDTSIRAKF
ncbi:hypothetical protein Droror1_Dr00019581, partial [Drosera rotundifolia]